MQAKFHRGTTGATAAEQIIAYLDHKEILATDGNAADDGYSRIAWVVSTCDQFSKECYARASEENVMLIDGKRFVELLLNVGIEGLATDV